MTSLIAAIRAASGHAFYKARRLILKRRLRLIAYRRKQLRAEYARELACINHEEMVTNAELRELQSARLHAGHVEMSA